MTLIVDSYRHVMQYGGTTKDPFLVEVLGCRFALDHLVKEGFEEV